MKKEDLPERWKIKIKEYLHANGINDRTELSAFDFPLNKIVKLNFEDESLAEFRYAFTIDAPEFGEVGVFTEHCGYHIFGAGGVDLRVEDDG